VDLPGFGLSTLPRAYGLVDYVEEIRIFIKKEILDPARMTKKVVLIGHSFGGQVGIKFALLHPEMLSGLVLVDAAGVRNNSFSMLTKIAVSQAGKSLLMKSPLADYAQSIRRKYYRLLGMTDRDYYATPDSGFLKETLGLIMRDDLTSEFNKINLPTLLFWGEKDEATPLKWGEILHSSVSGSKLVVVPGAGHFSYLDDQERFVREINLFIAGLK
jgi:pimeloyl-ACP methyl ester carboxylesterase